MSHLLEWQLCHTSQDKVLDKQLFEGEGWGVHGGGVLFFLSILLFFMCWTKCIPSNFSLLHPATSKAFRGWQINCLPVIKMCCPFMFMDTFLYHISWACCTSMLLNYDRLEDWSVNCSITCYGVTEILRMGFFLFLVLLSLYERYMS